MAHAGGIVTASASLVDVTNSVEDSILVEFMLP